MRLPWARSGSTWCNASRLTRRSAKAWPRRLRRGSGGGRSQAWAHARRRRWWRQAVMGGQAWPPVCRLVRGGPSSTPRGGRHAGEGSARGGLATGASCCSMAPGRGGAGGSGQPLVAVRGDRGARASRVESTGRGGGAPACPDRGGRAESGRGLGHARERTRGASAMAASLVGRGRTSTSERHGFSRGKRVPQRAQRVARRRDAYKVEIACRPRRRGSALMTREVSPAAATPAPCPGLRGHGMVEEGKRRWHQGPQGQAPFTPRSALCRHLFPTRGCPRERPLTARAGPYRSRG
jgi:hypothetical protein